MWNPFRRAKQNTQKQKPLNPDEVSCVALHELSSGDIRTAIYTVNDSGIQSLSYVGTQAGAADYRTGNYEYIVRHIPDHHYAYGTTYTPIPEEYVVYEDMASKGLGSHTLLRYSPIANGYYNWSALDTDQVVRSQKEKSTQSIGTGLPGLARLFSFEIDDVFLFVAVERYSSTVSLLRGEHVLQQVVVSVGTSTLVRTVADSLACPADMALRIITEHGLLDTHYDHRLKNRIVTTLAPLLLAVEELVTAYTSQPYRPAYARGPIRYWILGGVGSGVPGLASMLGLSTDAEYCDQIASTYKRMLVELPVGPNKSILPRYYTVLGLAIAGA